MLHIGTPPEVQKQRAISFHGRALTLRPHGAHRKHQLHGPKGSTGVAIVPTTIGMPIYSGLVVVRYDGFW